MLGNPGERVREMIRSLAKLASVALIIAGISACADAAADSLRSTVSSYHTAIDSQIVAR